MKTEIQCIFSFSEFALKLGSLKHIWESIPFSHTSDADDFKLMIDCLYEEVLIAVASTSNSTQLKNEGLGILKLIELMALSLRAHHGLLMKLSSLLMDGSVDIFTTKCVKNRVPFRMFHALLSVKADASAFHVLKEIISRQGDDGIESIFKPEKLNYKFSKLYSYNDNVEMMKVPQIKKNTLSSLSFATSIESLF